MVAAAGRLLLALALAGVVVLVGLGAIEYVTRARDGRRRRNMEE